jgi:PAS domain S-box-containing protein
LHAARLRQLGYFALATAWATLLLMALLSFQQWRRYDAVFTQASEARLILGLNRDLIDGLRDAETGQRGFLLTGREEYLDPYYAAARRVPDTLNQLLAATGGGDPGALAKQLREPVEDKLAELSRTIALYRSSGQSAALAEVQSDRGRQAMERARGITQRIEAMENDRRIASRNELQEEARNIRIVVSLGTLLVALLMGGGAWAVRRATLETERTEDLLRSTLYSIGDGVIATDRTGAVRIMNAVAERLTGYTESEARGKSIETIFRIVNEETRAAVDNPVRRVMREGGIVGLANHTVLISKSGREIPIDDCGAPVAAEGGSSRGAVLVFRDVSERRKAQETARRLAAIVEGSEDAIVGKTLDGIVTTWNQGAEKLFGYTAEEMIGTPISRLVPPEHADDTEEILSRIAKGESVRQHQTERMTKDGRRISVSLSVSPIRNGAGEVVGASKIARDTTHERQLEGLLRQAQKMEAVGRLAGGVAHDFNNLLTVILGYAASLGKGFEPGDPRAKAVAQIQRAATQAAAVTGQLLAFSRKQVTQPRAIDLSREIAEMQEMLQRLIGEDIDLSVIPDREPCLVTFDPGQLSQVLLNLAVNARDAMPTGGKLTIETHRVMRGAEDFGSHAIRPAGPYAQLVVTDTGSGMDQETQAHIFEPFFTTKEASKGIGLGLATVYGIVQNHGGWIDVYSEPGHGTTFRIYAPMARRAEADRVTAGGTEASRPRRTATILLVEDQAAIRMLAEDVLIDAGHEVLSAPNGRAALQTAEAHRGEIDLLITDVVMPELSGPELAEQLSRLRPDLLVLYISGYTDHALLHRGAIEQGTAFLQKPFLPAALLEKVDSLWSQGLSAHA